MAFTRGKEDMWRRFRTVLPFAGGVVVLVFVVVLIRIRRPGAEESQSQTWPSLAGRERQGGLQRHDEGLANAELILPSEAREGRWGDVAAGTRWEEMRRQIGIELSRRKEAGPVRCALRVRPGAAARNEPDLEVELTNTSDDTVTIQIHRSLLDPVTFIFRAPDDSVVSSFCYVAVHSTAEARPPVTLKPGESRTSQLYLSVAADHGFQSLRPGLYSLEAVFHEKLFIDLPVPDQAMLARSKRVAVRVGKM